VILNLKSPIIYFIRDFFNDIVRISDNILSTSLTTVNATKSIYDWNGVQNACKKQMMVLRMRLRPNEETPLGSTGAYYSGNPEFDSWSIDWVP
jgi:hypothetical protein